MCIAPSGQKGFTLIEIVMVIVLLGFIGVISFQVLYSGVEAFVVAKDRKELYDQGRVAMERMVRELRDANQIVSPIPGSGSATSINFIKEHSATEDPALVDNSKDITFQQDGTDLERVGDVSGTVDLATHLVDPDGFQVTHEGISFDNASSSTATNSASLTFSHAIGGGSNRLLVVGVNIEDNASGPTITSITYNGQDLTKIDSEEVVDTFMGRAELWYLLDAHLPASGTYNVVVNASASCRNLTAGAMSLTGVKQTAPEATAKSSVSGANNIRTDIITQTDYAWLVDVVHCGNATSFTPFAGQTERYDQAGTSSEGAGSTKPVSSAGATFARWRNVGANRLAHVVAAFAPSQVVTLELSLTSAGGGTIPLRAKVYPRNLP